MKIHNGNFALSLLAVCLWCVSTVHGQSQAAASNKQIGAVDAIAIQDSEADEHFASGSPFIHSSDGITRISLRLVVIPGGAVKSATPESGSANSAKWYEQAASLAKTWQYVPFERPLASSCLQRLTSAWRSLIVLRNNPHIYAEEVFATAEYNQRFGNIVRTIVGRGVGEGTLPVLAKESTEQLDGPRPAGLSDRALIHGVYEYACTSGLSKYKRQIEKAFAESADGDLVAAHIAFGNDYLCTEDQGRSAVSPSVFDAENRAWLKTEHGVEILNAQQLAYLL
jgi:hypothetical protein